MTSTILGVTGIALGTAVAADGRRGLDLLLPAATGHVDGVPG